MSNILNLKAYDIILTTAFEFKYGVCGHIFEMIDYYYIIKTYTTLKPCILLADGTTIEDFTNAIKQKYDDLEVENVIFHFQPKVIIANNILFVDGSHRLNNAEIFAKNIFLFRCSESDFTKFTKTKANVFLLQDFEIYDDRPSQLTIIDYKKKILFSKYKKFKCNVTDTAMFYLTTVCRALSKEDLEKSIKKHNLNKFIILTDKPDLYEHAYRIPLNNMWEMFNTYIYTAIPRKIDCSSRFILECMHYGKNIIYDIDYYDIALEVRKKDGLVGTSLTKDDAFIKLLNEQIKH